MRSARSGAKLLAIPHNGNLSNGAMFAMTDRTGADHTAYAETRARNERLIEIVQTKGSPKPIPHEPERRLRGL